jgi:hypothetical protein
MFYLRRQGALKPDLSAVAELFTPWQELERSQAHRKWLIVNKQSIIWWSGIRYFMTADTGFGFISSCIDPGQLVSEHSTVAIEYLEVKQPVGGYFGVE